MSDYSIEISGKYYKVDSQEILNEINSASSTSEKQEIISTYVASNKAVQINEDEYQEMQIDDEGETEGTEESEQDYPEGFNYESYKAYANSTGLTKLTEDSGLDELIEIFEKIEDEVNELDKKIASVDEDNPEDIAALLSDMTNMTIAIGELGKAAGVEFEKNSVVDKAVTSGVAGAIAVGIPVYCMATSAAAISTTIMSGAGVVAATSAAVPMAGWVVAGISGLVALGAGIWAYASSKANEEMEKRLAELQENIVNTADKLDSAWNKTTEKLQEGGKNVVDEVEKNLEGLLDDEFDFKDITDVRSVTKNIDKIIEAQEKLEPFYNVASTYGIEIEGLGELMEKLGTGDDNLIYAQEYLDAYAEQVDLNITNEVITDTESLNGLFEDINGLIEEVDGKGLDTSKLEDLLETIQKTNQDEADKTAEDTLEEYSTSGTTGGSTGIADTTQSLLNGSGLAYDTATQVGQNSSQYETSTDKLNETSETLKSKAQEELEAYVAGISISGLSVEELEELYNEVNANFEELKQLEGLDCSSLQAKLQEIRKAQQALVDAEIKALEEKIQSASTTEERMQILSELNGIISKYSSYSVSVSGASALIQQIIKMEEESIQSKADSYLTETNNATSSSEIAAIVNKIQIDIQNAQSMGCSVSAYQEILVILNQKLEQLQQEEAEKEQQTETGTNAGQNDSTSIVDQSTTNVDMNQDNSITIGNIDNSTTTNNSVNIGNIDNSTTINTSMDTSKIEELLEEILNKLDKEDDVPQNTKEPCEPEDEVKPEDNPNEEPGSETEPEGEEITEPEGEIIQTTTETESEPEGEEITEPESEIIQTTTTETESEPEGEEITEPEGEIIQTTTTETQEEEQEQDTTCETEDYVGLDNSGGLTETTETIISDGGPRTTAEINAGVQVATQEETTPEQTETTYTPEQTETQENGSATTTIIEGEGGYDYELDFEEEEEEEK